MVCILLAYTNLSFDKIIIIFICAVSIDYVSKLIVAIHDITSLKAYSSTKLLRIEIYVNDKFLRNLANVITKCVMIGKSSMEVSEHIMKIVQVEKGNFY